MTMLADLARSLSERPRAVTLFGAPEGYDAAAIGSLVGGRWLHVCRDDGLMARFAAALAFFHPELEALTFPAWDCLPYDRVSPNGEIVSRRIATLTRLATAPSDKLIVLTTVNALVQRVPPRRLFDGRVLTLHSGGRIGLDRLQSFFRNNGYIRTDTVREPGEFAIRGGIVDLYPAGAAEPVRLDFFGDTLESVRSFDPLNQRSTGKLDEAVLRPVSEVLLDDDAVRRFRSRYREQFGATGTDDPLYESVSAGRRYVGMEHWLPLYYEQLETVFDYLPGAGISFDYQAEEVRGHRLEAIADFYAARHHVTPAARAGAPVYRPIRPDQLYLDSREWLAALRGRPVVQLSPFAADRSDGDAFDAGARPARNFAAERADPNIVLFEAVRDYLEVERKSGRKTAIAAFSAGSADRLLTVLRDRGVSDLRRIADGPALEALPGSAVGLAVLPVEQGFATDKMVLLGEQDILGDRLARTARRRRSLDQFIAEATALTPGDLVVHADHGIGRYEALETIDVAGAPHDCVRLLYAGDDKLYVPVENIEVLSRFGSEDAGRAARPARRRRLAIAQGAGQETHSRYCRRADPCCRRAPAAARRRLAAARGDLRGIRRALPLSRDRGPAQRDRRHAHRHGFGQADGSADLRRCRVRQDRGGTCAPPSSRRWPARRSRWSCRRRCWRGSISAALPSALRDCRCAVGQLSRLVPAKDAREVKKELAEGRIDIVIGTHALLAKDVHFSHLGLLIVDEEQHFGVAQKEKLKQLKADVHVLTLTATPIPRTLQLALSGVREMSLIATPPVDRLGGAHLCDAVRSGDDPRGDHARARPRRSDLLRRAAHRRSRRGARKAARDGARDQIRRGARPHGALRARRRDDRFRRARLRPAAVDQHHRIGLDIPSANTMVVHRADMFGLAQLYQLRGRIGRSKLRGYAYLTLPEKKKLAADRAAAAGSHADPGHSGRRLSAGEPRPRHPRRRQSAGRRAVRPHPRGRHRALPAYARRGGRRCAHRRRRRSGSARNGARKSRSAPRC